MTTWSLIVAHDQNGAIGKDNDLPWRIPEDLKYFKSMTEGKAIIMGKNTFASLGYKPLPNRMNIVVSSNFVDIPKGDYYVTNGLDSAIRFAEDNTDEDGEIMIIGGASIYKQSIDLVDKMYVTLVDTEVEEADTFFPDYDSYDWDLVSWRKVKTDKYTIKFKEYERVK